MSREPPALEVMHAFKSIELQESFISAPLSCDDSTFINSLSALVCLAGSPVRRRTELVDITKSIKECCDDVRRDLMCMLGGSNGSSGSEGSSKGNDFYLNKTHNDKEKEKDRFESIREGPAGLRLVSIGALPFVIRFLIMGETLGENPLEIEESYGGYLSTDQFVRLHGTNGGNGGVGGRSGGTYKSDAVVAVIIVKVILLVHSLLLSPLQSQLSNKPKQRH
jgi:hypothetical protein